MNKGNGVRIRETKSFDDKAFDLLGELLIQREVEQLLTEIEADKLNGNTTEMDEFFVRHDQKNLDRINTYFRRQRSHNFFTRTLPKIGQIAAVFIATIALVGSVAIATNQTVRIAVMELLVNVEEEYTELQLHEEPGASFDIPSEWTGENYPAFIPEGMEMSGVHALWEEFYVEYYNPDLPSQNFVFGELSGNAVANVDTEDATITHVSIQGKPGTIARKGEQTIIYWDNGRKYFILSAEYLEESTVLRIADSVTRVD